MLSFSKLTASVAILLAGVVNLVSGETHTIHFDNKCGFGTPTLIVGGNIFSTGRDITFNGPIFGGIAYLQTGSCGFNAEGCTLIEFTLRNPPSPGAGSSTGISLIPPHSFSVASGFGYFNGCDGAGADCTSADCLTAFHQSSDTFIQVFCQVNNVNLAITFCS